MDSIEQRVASLERSARRWRWTAGVLGIGITGMMLIGAGKTQPVQDLIRVKEIEIVGEKGERACWIHGNDLGGEMIVYDKAGRELVYVDGNVANGGQVSLKGYKTGKGYDKSADIAINCSDSFGGSIQITGADEKLAAQMSGLRGGELILKNRAGDTVWAAPPK